MQLYVNYYDRYEKTVDENPTIGILLCTDKNDTAVKLALPEDNKTILASKYQLYLPTTEQLVSEINEALIPQKAAPFHLSPPVDAALAHIEPGCVSSASPAGRKKTA